MLDIVLLTGVSGAGKSTISHAFEEKGYRLIENVPNGILPSLIEECQKNYDSYAKTVIVVDIRHAMTAMKILKNVKDIELKTIALDCQKLELLSRFRLTRHIHPLQAKGMSLEEAIANDYENMKEIRALADIYIDTTGLSGDALRSIAFSGLEGTDQSGMVVNLCSFGYKFGLPNDAEVIIDCRNVPNPYWQAHLRSSTGLDKNCIEYMESFDEVETAFKKTVDYLDYYIAAMKDSGHHFVAIAFGCTGGQHRSVYFAQRVYEYFKDKYLCTVNHREIKRYR